MIYVGIWLLFGLVSAIAASNKGQNGCLYFALGVFLGPFGLILALVARDESNLEKKENDALKPEEKICPYCAETIKQAAIKCRYCGELLTSEPTPLDEGNKDTSTMDDLNISERTKVNHIETFGQEEEQASGAEFGQEQTKKTQVDFTVISLKITALLIIAMILFRVFECNSKSKLVRENQKNSIEEGQIEKKEAIEDNVPGGHKFVGKWAYIYPSYRCEILWSIAENGRFYEIRKYSDGSEGEGFLIREKNRIIKKGETNGDYYKIVESTLELWDEQGYIITAYPYKVDNKELSKIQK